MVDCQSIRLDEEYLKFSMKAQANRIIAEMDEETIGHPRLSKLIVKFFKSNNEAYLELIKTKEDKK